MRQYAGLIVIGSLLLTACATDAAGGRAFRKNLSEAGLDYGGTRTFRADKSNRRGDWKGARPAFWTLTASDGKASLRLEMTKNLSREQALKTMDERFQRIDALYSGGAAYPGMITTEFEVPPALRPRDITAGPGGNKAKALAAAPNMTYGAGAEDLVSHKGILGYLYCGGKKEKGGALAQIELFFPKKDFDLEAARREFGEFHCAARRPSGADGGKKK